MKQMLMLIRVLFSLVILQGLVACSDDQTHLSSEQVITVNPSGQLQVNLQPIAINYTTSGSITSDHRVSISTRLSGYIREILVREGDVVKLGQLLLSIDPVHAKQAWVQAKADLNNAKVEMQRYKSLLQAGAVTTQQADQVQLRYQVALSQLTQAKHQLSYAKVRSPVNGVVVEKKLSQGDLASSGLSVLSIEDPSSLLVQTYVSEQFVRHIHAGDFVDVQIAALDQTFKGEVRQVVQAADPVSHQFLVKVALPSNTDIHPGMYAQTAFHTGMRQALLLPTQSFVKRAGLFAVYVMDASHIIHYRLLRVGNKINGKIEILAGLQAGEKVVWDDQLTLRTGMKVQ